MGHTRGLKEHLYVCSFKTPLTLKLKYVYTDIQHHLYQKKSNCIWSRLWWYAAHCTGLLMRLTSHTHLIPYIVAICLIRVIIRTWINTLQLKCQTSSTVPLYDRFWVILILLPNILTPICFYFCALATHIFWEFTTTCQCSLDHPLSSRGGHKFIFSTIFDFLSFLGKGGGGIVFCTE